MKVRMKRGLLGLLVLCVPAEMAQATPHWEQVVATAIGKPGTEMPGDVYRITLPRSDLKVEIDDVTIKPALALSSWLAFLVNDVRQLEGEEEKNDRRVMMMGELVLTDQEVNPVMKKLIAGGFEVTALHNYLLRSTPHTMNMHISGYGDPWQMATALHEALALSGTPLSKTPAASLALPETVDIDTAQLDKILGQKGETGGGLYTFNIPRSETPRVSGMKLPLAMGTAITISFQPTAEGRAAITGDFVLSASEVNPVLRALRDNGIEVTALHNHMLEDKPPLFFMHFWAHDDAVKLAHGLSAALSHAAVAAR